MKLWKIQWPEAYPDETGLLLIRAESKERAIEIAKKDQYYDESAPYTTLKFKDERYEIEEVVIDGEEGVVAGN
jgi:hypothetical protein